jgi:hypothetical protein
MGFQLGFLQFVTTTDWELYLRTNGKQEVSECEMGQLIDNRSSAKEKCAKF